MDRNLQTAFNKLQRKKTELSKERKVALGLIDELTYDFNYLEDQSSLLSYLAYEWHNEKFEEYRQAFMTLNDEYTHNGSTVLRYDDVSGDRATLEKIAALAEEVGLEPNEVYDAYDDHILLLEEMEKADEQYEDNERQFRDWAS